jgi:hypothetical protein
MLSFFDFESHIFFQQDGEKFSCRLSFNIYLAYAHKKSVDETLIICLLRSSTT